MGREPSPRIFEPAYYDRLREIEHRHWWSRGMRRAMAALLEPHVARAGSLRVLDVGCGTGVLLESVRRWPLAGRPVGLDIAPEAIAHAGPRDIAALVRGDGSELPFREGVFDLVLCVDTVQHLSPSAAGRVVAEIRRVLRPHGLVYLRTNSALGHAPLRGVDPELFRRYDIDSVVRLIESAGLVVLRATYLNALAYDGRTATDLDSTLVRNLGDLDGVLNGTVSGQLNGNLLTSGSVSGNPLFGADGGHASPTRRRPAGRPRVGSILTDRAPEVPLRRWRYGARSHGSLFGDGEPLQPRAEHAYSDVR